MWIINKTAKENNLNVDSKNLTTIGYIEDQRNDLDCGIFHENIETEKGSQNDLDSGSINYLAISVFLFMQVFSAVLFYFLCDTTSFKEVEEINYHDNKCKKNFNALLSVDSIRFDEKSVQLEEFHNNNNLLGNGIENEKFE